MHQQVGRYNTVPGCKLLQELLLKKTETQPGKNMQVGTNYSLLEHIERYS